VLIETVWLNLRILPVAGIVAFDGPVANPDGD